MIIAILFNNNSGFNINIIIEIVNVPIIKLCTLLKRGLLRKRSNTPLDPKIHLMIIGATDLRDVNSKDKNYYIYPKSKGMGGQEKYTHVEVRYENQIVLTFDDFPLPDSAHENSGEEGSNNIFRRVINNNSEFYIDVLQTLLNRTSISLE